MLYCIVGWLLAAAILVISTAVLIKAVGWKIVASSYSLTVVIVSLIFLCVWLIQHCPKC